MTSLVAYLLLFVAVGAGFIYVHLVAGKFFRPNRPDPEKKTIYECGEPTIGSAWIQFDLRFYVVALLFVIFDVEVAFFFPWAVVFGKANAVAAWTAPPATEAEVRAYRADVNELVPSYRRRGGPATAGEVTPQEFEANREAAHGLAWLSFVEILVFFGVLLVGFAYLWRRGDLAWVRSLADRTAAAPGAAAPPANGTARPQEPALAGAARVP
jgi:NADH-quinone oxidoreductase subunit A